ncbi:MAG: biotin synthase BioB, partial [Candidatus Hydrogenedentes bacterium]|nr:biotin synthase BioB [Candidatus Hydrogenedentota bacterium]
NQPSVRPHASLGTLSPDTLHKMKASGLHGYHHNLETSRNHFPKVCTTHSYDERIATVRAAKDAGLWVCSGGLFGIGETWHDRIELAMTLRDLEVDSVPINFLDPIPGTRLESMPRLKPVECIRIIALMRFMLPTSDIRVCGGRERAMRDLQAMMFYAGANGTMLGDYLTTKGRPARQDIQMIEDLGLNLTGILGDDDALAG